MEFKCNYCNYVSYRKYNITRHYNFKHNNLNNEIENDNEINNKVKKDVDNENINNLFICDKCNKSYKTKKYYDNHIEKCKGINILTCPKCMKSFSSRFSKSKHIKRNTCKSRSIITINGNNNNITINNYGSERTDYITFDDIFKILKLSGNSIIPNYIQFKYFNKDFPENHNIKYEKNNNCFIKKIMNG